MRLAKRRQQLAHGQQMLLHLKMTVRTDPLQIDQAAAHAFDAPGQKGIGLQPQRRVAEQTGIVVAHLIEDAVQLLLPAALRIARLSVTGKQRVDPGLAAALELQQLIGHTAVCRNDEDAIVEIGRRATAENDVVAHSLEVRHRRATDFFYGVAHKFSCLPDRGRLRMRGAVATHSTTMRQTCSGHGRNCSALKRSI